MAHVDALFNILIQKGDRVNKFNFSVLVPNFEVFDTLKLILGPKMVIFQYWLTSCRVRARKAKTGTSLSLGSCYLFFVALPTPPLLNSLPL